MIALDVLIEDPRWRDAKLAKHAQIAADAVAGELQLPEGFEISILGCDDAKIAILNEDFRDKKGPTNVLSWPTEDRAPLIAGEHPQIPKAPDPMGPELGDVAIAYDTCAREAAEQGKPFNDHVTHLLVHGVLHLLGFDHINDADAACMEGFETRILAKLGIADPYKV